ncbi:MAG: nitrilase-related carbon-nitrogen hydrolase [candidate division WOR-3 bacterium]
MRIGFYQFAPRFGQTEQNLLRVERALGRVRADLITLPELFSTGYCFESVPELQALAEDANSGPTVRRLQVLANRTGIALAAGIAERCGARTYNSAVLVVPGRDRPVLTYRKVHLFGSEKGLFSPGRRRPAVVAVAGARIGIEICFDHFFPELARTLALRGVQIVCHPANLVLPYAQATTVARALENGIFWVLCNRTGLEYRSGRPVRFTGGSQIIGPRGEILARAGPREEVVKTVAINPARADDKGIFPGNDLLADRRVALYDLARRTTPDVRRARR